MEFYCVCYILTKNAFFIEIQNIKLKIMSIYINQDFQITEKDIERYRRSGFIKLKKFFTAKGVEFLKNRVQIETKASANVYSDFFTRMSYDILAQDQILFEIFADNVFRDTLTRLNKTSLFYAQGLGFELFKKKDIGFPWHYGQQSFGYIHAKDLGCTLWTPLVEIDPKKQRGGMAYVPIDIISAEFMFEYMDPAIAQYMRDKVKKGEIVSHDEVLELATAVLGSPTMIKLLNHFQVEDNFKLGDTLLFHKYVIHKSIKLEEGPIESRMAFAMRFVDENARYDKRRANDLNFPIVQFNYKPGTTFHIDVCKKDGEKISESNYFTLPEKRLIKAKKRV